MYIVIAILFLLQLISMYFIALLFAKVNKFNDLEVKQQKLMSEMEDVMSAYLVEVRDENEQFFNKLSDEVGTMKKEQSKLAHAVLEHNQKTRTTEKQPSIAMSYAQKRYGQTAQQPTKEQIEAETLEKQLTTEVPRENDQFNELSEVQQLHAQGFTIEEIAQKLKKGKTEVELMIKFQR